MREYLGIVSGDAVAAVAPHRTTHGMPLRIRSGRVMLHVARQRALREMARRASERGATVVIGVRMDYAALGGGQLLVSVTGTAVRM